jgi:hypothetical protein
MRKRQEVKRRSLRLEENTESKQTTRSQSTLTQSRSALRRELMWSRMDGIDDTDIEFKTAVQHIIEEIIGFPKPEYNGACILLQMNAWNNTLKSCLDSWKETKELSLESLEKELTVENTPVRGLISCL